MTAALVADFWLNGWGPSSTVDVSGSYEVFDGGLATTDVTGTYDVLAGAGSAATVLVTGSYTVNGVAVTTVNVSGTYSVLASTGLTANAGPDATAEGLDVVLLDGTASTGVPTSYAWTQTAGTAVTLTGASTSVASFTAPGTQAGGSLTFQLTVTKTATTATDTVVITVYPHVEWRNIAGSWVPVRTVLL